MCEGFGGGGVWRVDVINPNQLGRVWQVNEVEPNQLGEIMASVKMIGPNQLGRSMIV